MSSAARFNFLFVKVPFFLNLAFEMLKMQYKSEFAILTKTGCFVLERVQKIKTHVKKLFYLYKKCIH